MSGKQYMEEVTKENEKKEKTGKLMLRRWAVIGIVTALIVLVGVLVFSLSGGSSAEKLQKQLDLGQKNLEEMNYEEAVVAFEAAIEIDPMNVDAYLGLVEVYTRTEEFDTALEYAKKGYEATGDERLKEKMEMIESENQARDLQKQLGLGQQYLEEMNYEEAAAAFEAAIEIDPMNVDAYLGLVEVYIRTGEFDTALEYAKKGYEAIGDERLKEKIDMIESGNITASNGWEMKSSYQEDGVLLYYIECEYDSNGNRIVDRYYDADGTLSAYWEYEYDADGNRIVDGYYDADGTLYDYFENEYDTVGNCIVSRHYGADGTLYDYSEYEYDVNGNRIAERYYMEDVLFSENEYDTVGYCTVYRAYIDGILNFYSEYEYDTAGNCVMERHYESNGILYGYNEYEYDTEGKPIEDRLYAPDGNLDGYVEYEYDTEGNYIGKSSYDKDGNPTEIKYWKHIVPKLD